MTATASAATTAVSPQRPVSATTSGGSTSRTPTRICSLVIASRSSTATIAAIPTSPQRENGAGASAERTVHARHPPGGASVRVECLVSVIEERQPVVHPREREEPLHVLGTFDEGERDAGPACFL